MNVLCSEKEVFPLIYQHRNQNPHETTDADTAATTTGLRAHSIEQKWECRCKSKFQCTQIATPRPVWSSPVCCFSLTLMFDNNHSGCAKHHISHSTHTHTSNETATQWFSLLSLLAHQLLRALLRQTENIHVVNTCQYWPSLPPNM